ncbi:hypothetical protein Gotri_014747, partial [Gossypium trilobum]|nr:hypothetical protein [Gossypium trilobum]
MGSWYRRPFLASTYAATLAFLRTKQKRVSFKMDIWNVISSAKVIALSHTQASAKNAFATSRAPSLESPQSLDASITAAGYVRTVPDAQQSPPHPSYLRTTISGSLEKVKRNFEDPLSLIRSKQHANPIFIP